MPGDLWKELQDHVSEKKTQNSEASASGIIRGLVRDFLKKKEARRESRRAQSAIHPRHLKIRAHASSALPRGDERNF
jgi:hypothetical protein